MTEHSLVIDKEKCNGCTVCLRACPTQALIVRDSKARLINDRCIDCGECVRICPEKAIRSRRDPFETIEEYKYKLLVYSPVIFAQFKDYHDYKKVLYLFRHMGFDDITGVDTGGYIAADIIRNFLKDRKNTKRPYISTNCPVVCRLIQNKYPGLIEYVLPIRSIADISGEYLKHKFITTRNVNPKDVGLFYISPCPAKLVPSRQGEGCHNVFDGIFSMGDIYNKLMFLMEDKTIPYTDQKMETTKFALRWSSFGDVEHKFKEFTTLRIDGIKNVIRFLDRLENGIVEDVDFVDMYSCDNGCVGGVFAKEDPHIAEYRIKRIADNFPEKINKGEFLCNAETCDIKMKFEYNPKIPEKQELKLAIQTLDEIEALYRKLPKLDCAACGSATCYNFAEDIVVRKDVTMDDCPIIKNEKLSRLLKDCTS